MKQILTKNFKLIKWIHSFERSMFPCVMLHALFRSIEPYISVIGTAMILDALLDKDFNHAFIIMAVMIILLLVVQVLISALARKTDSIGTIVHREGNAQAALKSISLDHQTFQEHDSIKEFQSATYMMSEYGGFGYYAQRYAELLTGILGFIISMCLLIQFCLVSTDVSGVLSFIVTKTGSFIVIFGLMIVLGLIYFYWSKFYNKKIYDYTMEVIEVSRIWEYFLMHLIRDEKVAKEVRLYKMDGLFLKHWNDYLKKFEVVAKRYYGFEGSSQVVFSTLNNVTMFIGFIYVAIKAYYGALSIGEFTQYAGAFAQMNLFLKLIIESGAQIQIQSSYLSFFTDYMEKENKLDTGSLPIEKRNDNEYEIEFHNVNFKYPGSDEYSLKDINLKLDMKKKFAIVGRNGAGKTTLIKLLCRMYDVSEGMITLNGVDIRKYDYQEYLNLFAAVFQDFSLLSTSVGENVSSNFKYDTDKVWSCLDKAGIKDRVKNMENGLDTLLYHEMGDGVEISGGEAQKIAIARALYKDSPFIILDEPTAALDPLSEYEIYSRFNEMVNNKTSIYISHRMSSCRFCDDILVFDKARLVQRGSHEELMSDEKGVYCHLWNAQAQYYTDYEQDQAKALVLA